MPKLFYFQAPNFSMNPESETAPKLGSIILSLDRLTDPLNQFEHVHIPPNLKNQSAAEGFNESINENFTASVGLNTNLVQGTASTIYALVLDKQNIYHCDTLETVEFEPNKEFVSDSIIASQRVQAFLDNALPGRKMVYMITGLKIATGFSMSTSKKTQHGPKLKVGVKSGPEVGLELENARRVSHGRTTNKIVFAYRVIIIKRKRDGEAKYKYKSGGKYTVDDEDSNEKEELWDIEPLDEEDLSKDFQESVPVEMET
ncbi:uncharacterized protein K460DRAFT_327059 [Cucurbitaria berberidis CBS 394.84]|uniref:Uncharacterized protein n=1 Tax=Cucurbitaria berberidis CBS 394.84 TaxID=1168544 RepID=A0A9P4GPN8_9PLEO|nr:uncharacterized protein K460DRAFT_327059 [Cucurbitaria berberidis CBS 394.84]KAF1850333.1 hypothetical protein K460DRAFT_327059 [Cucurbitaria berberidis CBS 394.84]